MQGDIPSTMYETEEDRLSRTDKSDRVNRWGGLYMSSPVFYDIRMIS